jgi:hypothetical protein
MSIWATKPLDPIGEDFRILAKVDRDVKHKQAVERRLNEIKVGDIILKQLGGMGRLKAMIGARHFVALPKGVAFKWPARQRSKGNYVEITLRGDDTYDMQFQTVGRMGDSKKREKYTGLYADMLIKTFSKQTGLALRL